MKKLLLILLCVPLIFSCGDGDKANKENKDEGTYTWDNGDKYVGEFKNNMHELFCLCKIITLFLIN